MASTTWRACTLFLFLAITASANLGSGIGLAGQGRSLFTPACGFACLDVFWSLKLPCSVADPNTSFSINTPACHASSSAYLESLAWCLRQKCPGEGLTNAEIETFWLANAGDGLELASWNSYLVNKPTEILRSSATILLTPSLVNSDAYNASWLTVLSYASQEKYHAEWSTIVVVVSVGIALLVGMKYWLNAILLQGTHLTIHPPQLLKKYLLDPAFIGKRNLQLLPWKLGYVPQRSIMLLVIVFIAFNVAINFVNPPSFNKNDTWFTASTLYTSNLANRLGVLAVANLALAITLSGRNSPVLYLTGCSRTTIIAFHRWAGRVAVIKGVAHGIIYISTSNQYGMKVWTPAGALHYIGCDGSYWILGIATLAVFVAVLIFSLAPFRIYWYEAFLVTHVALVVAGLVTLWYHLRNRFHGEYGYEVWLYIAFAFWTLDRVIRVLRLVAQNFDWFIGHTPPANVELLSDGQLMKVTAYTTTSKRNRPGQYYYVYFLTLTWYIESHPFSHVTWGSDNATDGIEHSKEQSGKSSAQDPEVGRSPPQVISSGESPGADAHPDQPKITFVIRPCNGVTKRLHQRLKRSDGFISMPVLIEGPYSTSAKRISTSQTILAFAGGIGITGIQGHLNHHVATSKMKTIPNSDSKPSSVRRFILLWMVASIAEVEALMPLFPSLNVMKDTGVELRVICKGSGTERVDFTAEIVREKTGLSRKMTVSVLVCGPAQMADEIRSCVVRVEGTKGAALDLCVEAFAW